MFQLKHGFFVSLLFFTQLCFAAEYAPENREEYSFVDNLIAGLEKLDDKPNIWPGFSPAKQPLVLYFDEPGLIWGINIDATDQPSWRRVKGVNAKQDLFVASQDMYGIRSSHLYYLFPIGKQQSFVMQIMPSELDDRARLSTLIRLTDERFHQYQLKEASGWFDDYLGQKEFEVAKRLMRPHRIAMMQIENEEMAAFIHSGDVNHLMNYLAVATEVRNMLFEDEQASQTQRQNLEGMSQYVAFRTASKYYPKAETKTLIQDALIDFESDDNLIQWLVRDRHLGIGSGIAYALDHFSVPNWKDQVFDQGLFNILEASFPIPLEERTARASALIDSQKFSDYVTSAKDLVEEYQDHLDAIRSDFTNNESLKLSYTFGEVTAQGSEKETIFDIYDPVKYIVGFEGDIRKQNREVLSRLAFNKRNIMSKYDGERVVYFDEEQVTMTIDGIANEINMDTLMTRPFETLYFEAANLQADIMHPGQITFEKGNITLILTD